MSCFNGNSGNSCWIIILLLLCCGNNNGCGCGDNGLFGRSGGNGNDGCWIILLLLLCGCLGNNGVSTLSGGDCGCGCGCGCS